MCLFKRWTKLQIEAKTKNECFFLLRVCMWKQLPSISVQGTSSMVELIRRIQENGTHRFRCSKTGELRKRQRFFLPRPGLGTHSFFVPLLALWYPKDAPFLHRDPFINEIQGDFFFLHLQNKKRDEGLLMGFYFIKTFWGLFLLSRRFFSGGNHPVTFRWINDPQTAKPRRWKHDKTCGDCKGLFWKKCPHQTPKKSEKLNLSLFKKNQQHLCSSLSPDLSQLHEHSKKKWRVRVACMWGWRIDPWSLTDSSPLKKWGFGRWSWYFEAGFKIFGIFQGGINITKKPLTLIDDSKEWQTKTIPRS